MSVSSTDKYDTTIDRLGCTETPIKLCVDSTFSLQKCQALAKVFKSRRIRPGLECVTSNGGGCLSMVASSSAHITTADGGDVYHAFRCVGAERGKTIVLHLSMSPWCALFMLISWLVVLSVCMCCCCDT